MSVDRHEKSRSPENNIIAGRTGLVVELKDKNTMLETVIEDKDSQIKAMLETLDEKEKEIAELHSTLEEKRNEIEELHN